MDYAVVGIAMVVVIAVLVVTSFVINKKNKQLVEVQLHLEAERRRAVRAENKLRANCEMPDEE